jgi:hypothetical protein
MAPNEQTSTMLMDVATRDSELRDIADTAWKRWRPKPDLKPEMYAELRVRSRGPSLTFIHKCA